MLTRLYTYLFLTWAVLCTALFVFRFAWALATGELL